MRQLCFSIGLFATFCTASGSPTKSSGRQKCRPLFFFTSTALSHLSAFQDGCRMPNLLLHRARCCRCFLPLRVRNLAGLFAVLPLCSRQALQTHLQRCIVSVFCKFVSSYPQNSTFNNLFGIGSPLDSLRWVSQK